MSPRPPSDPAAALLALQQSPSLKILDLAETLSPKEVLQSAQKRNSGVSDASAQDADVDTNPAALAADLAHYKELFTKLRFSYVEQMTKEQFLRSITDNPPQLVEAAENDAKETEILALKAELKERKQGVAQLQKQLVEKGAELARRYEGVQLRTTQLESLPVEIEKLEQSIARLQQDHAPQSDNPELALPLAETTRLLQERQAESALLDAQIAKLKAQLPGRARELEKLERELKPLETQKQATVAAAKEAQRRREEGGGIGDKLEERGRWLRASEQALKDMLEVKEG